MDSNKWKSVAIRKEIVEIAREIGKETERPISNILIRFSLELLRKKLCRKDGR